MTSSGAGRRNSEVRAAQRRADAAIKLLVLGAGVLIFPFFVKSGALANAAAGLRLIGCTMLLAGGASLWFSRRSSAPARRTGPIERPPERAGQDRVLEARERTGARDAGLEPRVKPAAWGREVLDVIEWRRFEAVIEKLFQQSGLNTRSQSHGADGGVDVWLYAKSAPQVPVCLVQCKHWAAKVGVDKVRELRGVMASQAIARGVLAATSGFTRDAAEFAQKNGIDLLDVDRILALIAKRSGEQQAELLEVALEGEYWKPTCASCGVKMVERTALKGGARFWGCVNFPRCRSTLQIRPQME